MIKRLLYLRNTITSIVVLLVLLGSGNVFGQATLPTTRTTWNSTPTGWTDSPLDSYTSSFACSGNNGAKFDTTNDRKILFIDSAPHQLSFDVKSNSSTTSSLLVEESVNGTLYTTVVNLSNTADLPSTCTTKGPYNLNPNTRYIRWTFTKGSSNMTMDDVSVTKALVTTPCSGTPNASTVSLTPASGSPSTDYVVSATGYSTDATGLSYQWQYNINGGGWSNTTPENIPSSTTYSNYNATNNVFAPAIGQSVQWRLVTTCASSSLSNTSNIATFTSTLNYCTPAFSNNTDYIVNFGLESITNNNSGFSSGGYGNYTNLSTNLVENTNYTASLTSSTGSGNHGVSIWIDFNNNGTFETGERVGSLGNIVGPNQSPTIPITIPSGNLGTHRMRVIYQYNVAGTSIDPCVSAAYGEVEDYTINVVAACEAPTVTLQATPVTAITTETVSLHGNVTDEGDFTINTRGFEYSVNSTMLAAATKSSPATATGTYTENITGLTPNTVYYYRAYATNDCNPNKKGYSHTSAYPTFTTVHNAPSVGSGSGATSSSFVANWTAPTGGGSAAFNYEIQVDDDSNFGSVNFTANGITGISTLVNSGLTASTTYYYRVRAVNAGGNSAWSATSLGYATTAPAPEIKIKIGSTSIGFGINLSFGSQISGTTGSENTLIIENSGDAPLSVGALSISGTDAASFIITQPLSATVAAGGTTTFTVTFAPTTMGSKTAQLSLINGDADENPFLINLFGTGTANAGSDIITDNTFTYATNIDYKNYITADITALNSVELGRFIIRDGGTGDADNVGTTLTNLGITVGNFANLERLAIYDGATEIAEMPATATTYFSGLSLFATDNGTKTFTVRGSFKQTVTDKQRITLTLASTTASSTGSEFTTINATTSTIGNDNTISVTADRLAFTTQPTNVGINTAMANVVVAAVDINNNKDADATGTVTLTSTGTMTSSPLSGTLVSGSVTFSSIVHTVAQTGRNLIAKKTGFADLNSNLFDVTAIDYVTGDIVSNYDGTGLSYSSGWQYFNGSILTTVPDNKGPESTSTTIATVYINHIVDGGGNAVKNYNCNFVIGSGGKLTLSDVETTPSTFIAASKRIEVLSGGILQIDGDMGVNSTGKLIVRSGGTLIINSPKATNSHPMWTGEENFENGSTVIINNWKWDASASTRSLMNTSTDIKNNDGGYKFGNLIIDINPTDSFVLIGGGIGVIKLCQNDLEIINSSTNYVHGASNASTAGFEIGGNMIIYDGPFSFGANFSSGTNNYTHNFIINGNFNCESNDALKINYRSNGTNTLYGTVTFRGNVTIGSNVSSITQDVSNSTRMNVILEGGNALSPKFIDIAPTAVAIPMTINNGYRKLQNHDLNLNSVTGYTTSFTLKSGATLDFGLSSTNTGLNIKSISGVEGTNAFIAENGSTLKITSDGGIATSGATGNVQTTTPRTFSASDYHYTGISNQDTGTGLPTSGAKITIANTGTAPDNEVRLTNESTSVSALEITNGVFNLNEKTLTGTNLSIAENATLKIVGTQSFPSFTNKTFHANGIVEYGGSNQSIAALTSPTYTKLKVSGTGKKVLSGTSVEVGNNLNITSSLLEISEGQTLRVHNEISTVDTDATNGLFIKNGGSLVQIANVDNQSSNINVGKIKMERITKPMYRLDYTYWSAPVSGNTLVALSPNSPANRFFHWNPDAVSPAPNWAVITGGTAQMLPGKGYIIRAPTVGNGTDASNPASYTPYTGNFNGKPNNGTVTTPISGPEKWNLIGNPYPSAIDAEKFLDDNDTTLDGTLYFWTHNTPLSGASGYGYSSEDYAAWNGTGSLATVEALSDTDPADNKPKGFIAAGQSFFVKGLNNGNAVFTNSMRENANNMQFFRSSNTENTTEKHRIWLNLKGAEKGFSQTLVGYVSNATNGQDNRFDGELFGGNAVTFYSVMENKNWSIQGRALPFTTADEVPLGYKTTLTGTLIINIDDRDGQLANQTIYLKDNLLNVVHNLTDGPYTFTSTPGTYDDRFVLRYLPGENLDNPTFEDQMNGLTIRKNNADIYINSSFENIDAVLIYDTTGRLLFEKEKCNTTSFKASNLTQSEQMLIVKVRLNNGGVVTKKVW